MTDPNRNLHMLQPYRGQPPEIRYERGEHAAVCRWCKWSDIDTPFYCYSPRKNPTGGKEWAKYFNNHGQCDCYYPSLWTRLLQALHLRPWIEQLHNETEGT